MDKRVRQFQEVIKDQLSKMILKDLPEEYGLVTITDVYISPDLRTAKVYLSFFNRQYIKKGIQILESHIYQYQHLLGKMLKTRFSPKLEFIQDQSSDQINKIENILHTIDNSS